MGMLASAPVWTPGHVVLAAFLVFMLLFLLAIPLTVVLWTLRKTRDRRAWRREAGEPFIPSRVWLDERYGGTDADVTRRTGWLGSTETEGYNAAAEADRMGPGRADRPPR